MIPFATFIDGKLRWNYQPRGKQRYRIVMWAKSENGHRDEVEVKPKSACTISDLLPIVDEHLKTLLDNRTDLIGYGFSAYVWS